MFFYLDHVKNL